MPPYAPKLDAHEGIFPLEIKKKRTCLAADLYRQLLCLSHIHCADSQQNLLLQDAEHGEHSFPLVVPLEIVAASPSY